MILYHYSRKKVVLKDKDYTDGHPDKPHGLWLSSDGRTSPNNWLRFTREQIEGEKHKSVERRTWCYFDIRYETRFEITTPISAEIKVIRCEKELDEFMKCFRQTDYERCLTLTNSGWVEKLHKQYDSRGRDNGLEKCYHCFGLHLDWKRVKEAFDGVALRFWTKDTSRHSKKYDYHWSVFDKPSWCIWEPTKHLTQLDESVEMPYLNLDWKCQECEQEPNL